MASDESSAERKAMRRVQRDATKELFIQELCDSKTGCFGEIWRLLIFAALLGKAKGRRQPLTQVNPQHALRTDVFQNSPLWPGILHLLAITENKSPDCLRHEHWETNLAMFEEYANGGLSELQAQIEGPNDLKNYVAGFYAKSGKASDVQKIRL